MIRISLKSPKQSIRTSFLIGQVQLLLGTIIHQVQLQEFLFFCFKTNLKQKFENVDITCKDAPIHFGDYKNRTVAFKHQLMPDSKMLNLSQFDNKNVI